MKIVNIMTSRDLGGVEQAFLDYNRALNFKGHQVFAIYNKMGKIRAKIEKLENVKYIPMLFFKPYFMLFPNYLFRIRTIKPDLIIVHSRKALPIFSFIARLLKVPVVIVCHNDKTKLLNLADYVFSITEYQKKIFIENGFDGKKIFVIPNLIALKKDFKEFRNFSNPPVFGVIGRFDPMKGFSLFVDACSILKARGIQFMGKIGGVPQRQYIDEYHRIKNRVRVHGLEKEIEFLGWIDDKDEFYNNIDIFVLPSVYEPFGIVLLEAMVYSRPIISSLAEGPSEIFHGNNAAITFKVGCVEELANCMEELINNPKIAGEISKNGYELVNKKYSLEKVAEKLDGIVRSII